ncbi:hypothetical protein CC1G_09122 [Coprinopsis cinerea okayama7|uniref:Uncharacterized protein n=1 Tax=Coprinopsis cinerea (strain Okayama-7 / 130 / ATCC MYA-4618 / FGSC 9003) TaxID=240176 RepID=A8NJ79_COPC7|nr:hypothetical protein CC1G_09122 [Coprinopsis cinerea okayama7\|eukprot:XP_001834165.1 hypothetical protein CC1G_09122 [Coprinopsis cinerea okayama7\
MTTSVTSISCRCAHDNRAHVLIRCGCTSDEKQPNSGSIHVKDDGYHRTWCTACLQYCSKASCCPSALPQVAKATSAKRLAIIRALLKAIAIPRGILSATRSWIASRLLFWAKKPAIHLDASEKPLRVS